MKKSIFKVTAWSLLFAASIIYVIERSNNQSKISKIALNASQLVEVEEDNTKAEGASDPQSTEYYSSPSESNVEYQTSDYQNESYSSVKKQDASVVDMSILSSTELRDETPNNNAFEQTENSIAKGGPNNVSAGNTPVYNSSSSNGVIVPSASSNVSSSNAVQPVARVSAPTVVTTPPNPSGSSSGGSGAGDPYVPIDDYYGLIFLIAVSTVIGVFTLKKSKVL